MIAFIPKAKLGWSRPTEGMVPEVAVQLLQIITGLLDNANIIYHLEGGTLLGIARDGGLLPWDKDMDISVAAEDIEKVSDALAPLTKKGWKLRRREFCVPCEVELDGTHIVKVKDRTGGIMHGGYCYLDIFAKKSVGEYTYWQAAKRIMRVSRHYYDGFDELPFRGKQLKVPVDYRDYLTDKYGDWSIPVKEWNCAVDEKTVISGGE